MQVAQWRSMSLNPLSQDELVKLSEAELIKELKRGELNLIRVVSTSVLNIRMYTKESRIRRYLACLVYLRIPVQVRGRGASSGSQKNLQSVTLHEIAGKYARNPQKIEILKLLFSKYFSEDPSDKIISQSKRFVSILH